MNQPQTPAPIRPVTPESVGGAAYLVAVSFFAADRHRQQRRKDREMTPYINHPLGVANALVEAGETDPVTLAIAVGHDLVEDTDTTAQELGERFGALMRDGVLECSDDKSLPFQARKDAQIADAAHASERGGKVKMADKIINLRDLGQSPPPNWGGERVGRYFDWAAQVVEPLLARQPRLAAMFKEAHAQRDAAMALADRLLREHQAAHGARRGPL